MWRADSRRLCERREKHDKLQSSRSSAPRGGWPRERQKRAQFPRHTAFPVRFEKPANKKADATGGGRRTRTPRPSILDGKKPELGQCARPVSPLVSLASATLVFPQRQRCLERCCTQKCAGEQALSSRMSREGEHSRPVVGPPESRRRRICGEK